MYSDLTYTLCAEENDDVDMAGLKEEIGCHTESESIKSGLAYVIRDFPAVVVCSKCSCHGPSFEACTVQPEVAKYRSIVSQVSVHGALTETCRKSTQDWLKAISKFILAIYASYGHEFAGKAGHEVQKRHVPIFCM